jgi:tight adherence protein C
VTAAALLATAAAVLAAAATVDLAAALGERRAAGRPPRRALLAALARVGRGLGAPAPPADLAVRIDAAGAPAGLRVGDVMAIKAAAALLSLPIALPVAAWLPGRLGPVAAVAAPVAGFLAPDAWLARRARRRARAMAAELPDVLDLLRVAVDAGLTPGRALSEVGRRRHGPLAAEVRAAAARIALGEPRARVLARLERRCPAEGIAPFVAALARAERHGAPLGPALAALAADARARHAQRLRERAARAAPKIQLVVAVLLVPAVMLLVGATLVSALR